MQITKVNWEKNYISFDEIINFQFTLKMGSSEYITASGSDITAYVGLVQMERTYTEGVYSYKTPYQKMILLDCPAMGRGASKTFEPLDEEQVNAYERENILKATGDGGAARRYPVFLGVHAVDNDRETAEWVVNYATEPVQVGYFLTARLDPVIADPRIGDNGVNDPQGTIGSFVQGYSKPYLSFDSITLDPLDPTLTATYTLTLTDPNQQKTVYTHDPGSGEYEYPGLFQLDKPSVPGNYQWTFVVTDSAGHSASKSGAFVVLAYEPPRIDAFSVQRYVESLDDEGHTIYVPSDDGTKIWYTLDATICTLSGKNAWFIDRMRNSSSKRILSGSDGTHIVRTNDRTLDTEVYPATENIDLSIMLFDKITSVYRSVMVPKAGTYFDVEKNGVAIGQRSTGTPERKKFEVAEDYETCLYGGISYVKPLRQPNSLAALGIQFGTVQAGGNVAGGTTKDFPVVFPVPYKEGVGPVVFVNFNSGSTAGAFGRCCCSATDVSNTGFTLRFFNGDSSNRNPGFFWLAINTGESALYQRPESPMTANESQNCVASASSTYNNTYAAWRAFDGSNSTFWAASSNVDQWIQLDMDIGLCDICVQISSAQTSNDQNPTAGIILGSQDGWYWDEIGSFSGWSGTDRAKVLGTVECRNEVPYSYIQIQITGHGSGSTNRIAIGDITITGRVPVDDWD